MSNASREAPLPLQTLVGDSAGIISFTTVKGSYGWLGNMAPFPLVHQGVRYRTPEALFQCLRFDGAPEIQEKIRAQASPMAAKWTARDHAGRLRIRAHLMLPYFLCFDRLTGLDGPAGLLPRWLAAQPLFRLGNQPSLREFYGDLQVDITPPP